MFGLAPHPFPPLPFPSLSLFPRAACLLPRSFYFTCYVSHYIRSGFSTTMVVGFSKIGAARDNHKPQTTTTQPQKWQSTRILLFKNSSSNRWLKYALIFRNMHLILWNLSACARKKMISQPHTTMDSAAKAKTVHGCEIHGCGLVVVVRPQP